MRVWDAVDRVVDRESDLSWLRAQGLHLWAAQRWRVIGRPVPPGFLASERAAAMAVLAVRPLLVWVRSVVDGPVLLLKGPEVAARYPDPALRPFGDLDLLVPSADEVQRALLAAGCVEVAAGAPHHRPALRCPGALLLVEIHDRPAWPRWTTARTDDLFASAEPSVLHVDGISTVPPGQQAVLLAAHSWNHEPFCRLVDLVDIAAMAGDLEPGALRELAERWGLGRVWLASIRAVEALRTGEPPAARVDRLLGRHLWAARERTVIEWHLARWAAGLWAPSPSAALGSVVRSVAQDVRPTPGTSWGAQPARMLGALRSGFRPMSERQTPGRDG